jgi:hypothetical protein
MKPHLSLRTISSLTTGNQKSTSIIIMNIFSSILEHTDSLYGLLVRVPGYISRGPGSIPGAKRFSEK